MSQVDAFDVIVLGGGIVGTACFAELVMAGKKVLLLEENRVAQGVTGWSGAVVRVTHGDQQNTVQAAYGLGRYQDLVKKTRGKVAFHSIGYLHFAEETALDQAQEHLCQIKAGFARVSQGEIDDLYPELGFRAGSAIYEPDSGYMDPVATAQAFAAIGRENGGELRECVGAQELVVEAGRITGVETHLGRVRAETVVLATGEATPRLLARAGYGVGLVRSQLIQVTLFSSAYRLEKGPAFIDAQADTNGVFCPLSGGFYVGLPTGIARESGDRFAPLNVQHADKTRIAAMPRIGWLKDAKPRGALCHTDAYSDHPNGLIGAFPGVPEGLLLATGFSGGGYKMAPYAAAKITAAVAGRQTSARQENETCA